MIRVVVLRIVPVLLLLFSRFAAAEQMSRVSVTYNDPALKALADRVDAELKSAGRENVSILFVNHVRSCAAQDTTAENLPQVEIFLQQENDDQVSGEVCVHLQANQFTVMTMHGRVDEKNDFAIVVTEAIHGLLVEHAESLRSSNPDRMSAKGSNEPAPELEPRDKQTQALYASLSLEPRIAWDVPTGGVWVGIVPQFQLPLSKHVAVAGEVFLGLVPIVYEDAEIELRSHMIWARWGVTGFAEWKSLAWGGNVSVGPYSVQVTARAISPRIGGSDNAWGAILHTSGFLEFPARGPVFLRGLFGVSTLLPRVRYQMSNTVTPNVGEVLLEGGLGVGVRFDTRRR